MRQLGRGRWTGPCLSDREWRHRPPDLVRTVRRVLEGTPTAPLSGASLACAQSTTLSQSVIEAGPATGPPGLAVLTVQDQRGAQDVREDEAERRLRHRRLVS